MVGIASLVSQIKILFNFFSISCVLCGIVLTWRGDCYQQLRPLFLLLIVYIGSVQLLQTKYQIGCLRRLHALGQRYQMDISFGYFFKINYYNF